MKQKVFLIANLFFPEIISLFWDIETKTGIISTLDEESDQSRKN